MVTSLSEHRCPDCGDPCRCDCEPDPDDPWQEAVCCHECELEGEWPEVGDD